MGMSGQKDVKSQRSERSRVKQCLLDGTASGSHEHTAAMGICTRPAQDEARWTSPTKWGAMDSWRFLGESLLSLRPWLLSGLTMLQWMVLYPGVYALQELEFMVLKNVFLKGHEVGKGSGGDGHWDETDRSWGEEEGECNQSVLHEILK